MADPRFTTRWRSGRSLTGTWTLIGIDAHTTAAVDQVYAGDDYKDVTTSDYSTTNNGGTIAFNGGVETETGITYEANFIALDSTYLDGQLVSVNDAPYDITIPAASGTSKYQQIGSDSLYFPAGGVFTVGSTSGTQTTTQGARFTIHGDTLAITTRVHQVTPQNYGGIPATETGDALETAYLTKQ